MAHHLVLHACGWSGTSTLVGFHRERPCRRCFHPLDKPGSDGQLLNVDATLWALCEGRVHGLDQPLLFAPGSSFDIAQSYPPASRATGTPPPAPNPEQLDHQVLKLYPLLTGYQPVGPARAWSLAQRVWWPALPFLEELTP